MASRGDGGIIPRQTTNPTVASVRRYLEMYHGVGFFFYTPNRGESRRHHTYDKTFNGHLSNPKILASVLRRLSTDMDCVNLS